MNASSLLNEINEEIRDIFHQSFTLETTDARVVPNYDSQGLTFERNNSKRGKELTTCVLYIDIRNSTQISNKLRNRKDLLAKVYTSFAKSMITVADNYNGFIRNIIGDRVMVVFAPQNCFTDSINCALAMNSVANHIIPKYFKEESFKCGIGIDYGTMKVLKVGRPRRDNERDAFKNLVWLGDTANIASKLTDIANKTIIETQYKIKSKLPTSLATLLSKRTNPHFTIPSFTTEILTAEQLAKRLLFSKLENKIELKGKLVGTTMTNIDSITSEEVKQEYPSVLISKKVFDEYKRLNYDRLDIKNNSWKILKGSNHFLYGSEFYGSSLYYTHVKNL